jgi:alpha-L-rhamnosidase
VIQTDKYICKGNGEYEIWEPRFTYHGFRYVEMSGYPGTPTLENIEGVVVFTSAEQTGQFSCSDSMLNKIHNAVLWTITSNMHSIITDCPHREKCGWLGDVLPEVLIYNFDMHKMLSKFERDIETSRLGEKPGTPSSVGLPGDLGETVDYDGIPWAVSPGRRTGGHRPDWGSTFIRLPWFIYLYYGDAELATEHWGGMVHYIYHMGRIANGHIIYQGYGDMFSPGTIWSQNPPVEIISTALYYFNSQIMSKMADVLNYPGKADEYKALAHQIKTAFNSHFYDHSPKSYKSQTANSMALELGLVPAGDENIVAKNLVADIIDNHNGHFSTGIWAAGTYTRRFQKITMVILPD